MDAFNQKGQGVGRCLVPAFDKHMVHGQSTKASKVVDGDACANNN